MEDYREVSAKFRPRPLCTPPPPRIEIPRYPWDRRLDALQKRYGCCGDEKNLRRWCQSTSVPFVVQSSTTPIRKKVIYPTRYFPISYCFKFTDHGKHLFYTNFNKMLLKHAQNRSLLSRCCHHLLLVITFPLCAQLVFVTSLLWVGTTVIAPSVLIHKMSANPPPLPAANYIIRKIMQLPFLLWRINKFLPDFNQV
jgi:hypothetical protein